MEGITLGQIANWLAVGVALAGSITAVIKWLKKALNAMFKEQLDTIEKRFDAVEKRIDAVDVETTKNFIVSILADIDRGLEIDEVQRERFYEQFDHYLKKGGNSYIQARVNELKAAGKL